MNSRSKKRTENSENQRNNKYKMRKWLFLIMLSLSQCFAIQITSSVGEQTASPVYIRGTRQYQDLLTQLSERYRIGTEEYTTEVRILMIAPTYISDNPSFLEFFVIDSTKNDELRNILFDDMILQSDTSTNLVIIYIESIEEIPDCLRDQIFDIHSPSSSPSTSFILTNNNDNHNRNYFAHTA